jgi:phosphopantetheine--protein transferase-like protein
MGGAEMSLRVRVGVDLVQVTEFIARASDEAFLHRAFADAEIGDGNPEHLAGIFAAKEACYKAIGAPANARAIGVRAGNSGRPRLCLAELPPGVVSLDLSIAHSGDFAIAVVAALVEESVVADEECR